MLVRTNEKLTNLDNLADFSYHDGIMQQCTTTVYICHSCLQVTVIAVDNVNNHFI